MPKNTKLQTSSEEAKERKKDPAAVSLGRRGGLKGGKARIAQLNAKERSELARMAANARWSKPKDINNI